jgi:uncharacterized membrane protein
MPSPIRCPSCKQPMRLPDVWLALPVQCVRCRHVFSAAEGLERAELVNPPPVEESWTSAADPVSAAVGPEMPDDDRPALLTTTASHERSAAALYVPPRLPGRALPIVVSILLVLCALMSLVMLLHVLARFELIEALAFRVARDFAVSAERYESRGFWLTLAALGVNVLAIIFFCIWIHNAHANLKRLGSEGMAYTPGWAAGSWFIPIVNLFRPFHVLQEIWKASAPRIPEDPVEWQRERPSGLVGLFWALAIPTGLLAGIAAVLVLDTAGYRERWLDTYIGKLRRDTYVLLAVQAGSLLCAILTMLIVLDINARQTRKYALILASERDHGSGGVGRPN